MRVGYHISASLSLQNKKNYLFGDSENVKENFKYSQFFCNNNYILSLHEFVAQCNKTPAHTNNFPDTENRVLRSACRKF